MGVVETNAISSFDSPSVTLTSLAFDGKFLYACDLANDIVYKMEA